MHEDNFRTPCEVDGPSPPPASGLRSLFLNEAGLRAGWRLLIYIAIFFVLWTVSIFLLGLFFRPTRGVFSPRFQFFG